MIPLPDGVLSHLKAVTDLPDLNGTRYELEREIGRGGMGTVYLVHDRVLDRRAALKVLRRGGEWEAHVMASLEHPGIVPVYDAGDLPDGRQFYVMRFLDGQRLQEWGEGQSGLIERLRVLQKICDAVEFAHSRGVIHRDLSPRNILVGSFGEVWILDWGLARTERTEEAPGSVMGTPRFMAPEIAEGKAHEAGPAVDIFSLGKILVQLLPASAPKPLHAVAAHAAAVLAPDRYSSVADLAGDIARHLEGQAVSCYRETLAERLLRFARNNQTLLLLVGVYLAVKVFLFFLRPA